MVTTAPSAASLIVQICPPYVDLEQEAGGGVSNLVRQISIQLAKMGREVLILCGDRTLGRRETTKERVSLNPRLRLEVFPQFPHPILGPTGLLRRRLRALPDDCIVHVHTCFSAFTEAAMATSGAQDIPFIFTPHGKLSPLMLARHGVVKRLWWDIFAKRCVQNATMVAVSSQAEVEYCIGMGVARDSRVVPNGHDIPEQYSAGDAGPPIAEPYVLYLGYIDPRKQPEFLVQAFAKCEARKTHKLMVAGSDSYGHADVVKRAVDRHGLGERVVFWGPAYGKDKLRLLHHAACLGLPSRAEGVPLILCDALGAGLPTIYSAACNFPEIAARGGGYQISDWSAETWASALDQVCLNQTIQMTMQNAAMEISKDYTWKAVAIKWSQLYDEALSASPQRNVQARPGPSAAVTT